METVISHLCAGEASPAPQNQVIGGSTKHLIGISFPSWVVDLLVCLCIYMSSRWGDVRKMGGWSSMGTPEGRQQSFLLFGGWDSLGSSRHCGLNILPVPTWEGRSPGEEITVARDCGIDLPGQKLTVETWWVTTSCPPTESKGPQRVFWKTHNYAFHFCSSLESLVSFFDK